MDNPFLLVAEHKGRQTIENPKALPLVAGEYAVAEIYVSTNDVRLRGFQWMGTGREGKLVLTNFRLFYCFYDQSAFAFALEPGDVSAIVLPPVKFLTIRRTILITARLVGEAAPRTLTFAVPGAALVTGFGKTLSYTNPSTPEAFTAALEEWRRSPPPGDEHARAEIDRQRKQIFAAMLAAETRASFLRIALGIVPSFCIAATPILGYIALRDARRLKAMAEREGVEVPARVAWIRRLAVAGLVVGGLWFLLMVIGLLLRPD